MCRSRHIRTSCIPESVKLNVRTTKHGSRIRWFWDEMFFLPISEGPAAVLFVRDGKTPRGACRKSKAYYAYLIYLGKIGSVIPSRIVGADSMHRQSSHQNPGPGYRTCGNPAGDSISTPVCRAEALLSSMGLTWLNWACLSLSIWLPWTVKQWDMVVSIGSMESVELCILKGNI